MGESFTINSDTSYTAFCKHVKGLYEEHHYITYSKPRIGADRSLPANGLSHVWYDFADKMLTEQIGTTRRYCKLHYGVPIMRGEDDAFRAAYDKAIKPHNYEDKLGFMDFWPVTSLMSREQMCRYLTAVQVHYASERGLVLESTGEFAKHQRKNQ